ncbi:unnamed protein product [Oikopleura dioica]|uniref:Uncharacterized protein n=1 Tax=Oikopleura dioica TaxID=34765 RepID=E4WYE3_OIKDI|nr:unnamed protein product [Oikopleura dioica]
MGFRRRLAFKKALKNSTQAEVNDDPAKQKPEQSPPPSRGHYIDGDSVIALDLFLIVIVILTCVCWSLFLIFMKM